MERRTYRHRRRSFVFPVFMITGAILLSACCLFIQQLPKQQSPSYDHPILGHWKTVNDPVIVWKNLDIDNLEMFHGWKAIPGDEKVYQTYTMKITGDEIGLMSEGGGFFMRGKWSVSNGYLYLTFRNYDKTMIFSRTGK